MKTKVLYIFAFMLLLDVVSSCDSSQTYTIEINKAYMNVRDFANNITLAEKDKVSASNLEANVQLEWVQIAANFKMPSLFSNTAYAKGSNYYNFNNGLVKVTVLTKTEFGVKTDITDKCIFLIGGTAYNTQDELVIALNAKMQKHASQDSGAPAIGYKVKFDSSIKSADLQQIKIEMEFTDRNLNTISELIEIE